VTHATAFFLCVQSSQRLRVSQGALRRSFAADQSAGAHFAADTGPGRQVSSGAELEAYLREAESWDADRVAQCRHVTRLAWLVAAAGWTCAVAASVALVVLMPLKRVDPFVVRVDNATGIVDVVPAYDASATPQETVTRYFLTHYLTVCERFNFATAESDYEECGAFHSPQRNQMWYALWTATNPASPLNVHKDGSSVRVQVKSVSFFTRASGLSDLAQVRYLKAHRQGIGAEETFSHWVATIQYAYAEPAKDPKTRRWNPLGFKIIDFKSEPEASVEEPTEKEHRHDS
jgi:type IV secretion system protein VirB8